MVLRSCWIVLAFQLLGFFSLVIFEQGTDVLRTLSFSASGEIQQHSWFSFLAVGWWSWQSWRSARTTIHFSSFDFKHFSRKYAMRAQVIIPRLLGIGPPLIFAYGIYKASSLNNPLIYLYICLAIWLYIFFHLRKDIIVYMRTRKWLSKTIFPDYVMIKNETYPAHFIWAKQSKWILFRFVMIFLFVFGILVRPVSFPQFIGPSAIVLFALGSWLVIGTFLNFAETHYRFPFSFTLVLMLIGFSFFNNNHQLRSIPESTTDRYSVDEHFRNWYNSRQHTGDSLPVILVAAEGGGVRSAYWTASVLSSLSRRVEGFDKSVYAYSAVSGGSLGISAFKRLKQSNTEDIDNKVKKFLSQDFLSPVTAWLVMPEMVQKFLPFPLRSIDRAKALEYAWEDACSLSDSSLLKEGFLSSFSKDENLLLYHSTHAENGFTTLVSNAALGEGTFSRTEDLFEVLDRDIPLSTAISVSSRFPFLTPPAQVRDTSGKIWGHLVDGGYVENMGARSLIELYEHLGQMAVQDSMKIKFRLLFIRNTKAEYSQPIKAMHEWRAPLTTFSKVWLNSGLYTTSSPELKRLRQGDDLLFVTLDRTADQLIPLGWYLSDQARADIDVQLLPQTVLVEERLRKFLEVK